MSESRPEQREKSFPSAREIAIEGGVSTKIISLLDGGGLDNWKGVSILPEKLAKAFEETLSDKENKILLIANILARASRNLKSLLDKKPELLSKESKHLKEGEKLLILATLLYSYPQGIEPTNQIIVFQIGKDETDKLENFFSQLGSFKKAMNELRFTPNKEGGNWVLTLTSSQLEEKIREIIGIQNS